ncbi:PREDICTED: lysine-specific demethylase JMJ15-like [Camelina sativa]|uniref:Lysine-specific demethylase JMJ15-like n=1 Tax=Camelina sativa TaxID=90675 RepID=A0ABM0Z2Z1_CAMSA|nr:PREDICTED: lysine-specific demethylase JMJ15-like [Camelina sativa]
MGFNSMEPFSVAQIQEDKDTNVDPPSSPRHRKVLGRWDPSKARRPDIRVAPTFRPSSVDFEDPIAYIEKIRSYAEPYGICRIIPPLKWSPPCRLKERALWEDTKFPTRIQIVDLLQNREAMKKKEKPKGRKRKRGRKPSVALPKKIHGSVSSPEKTEEEKFGFSSGSDFTLKEFEKYDRSFKKSYFERKDNAADTEWAPSVEEIEGEYWRIIEKPTDEVEVYYGADLERRVLGSGFYKGVDMLTGDTEVDQYIHSGWNLNNLPRLPGSLLSYEPCDISGVVVPWLYVGMCFSTFCWHVEDHHLYSVNYNHFGSPKVWYGVPGNHATALEETMRKHLPDLFAEQPDLLHGLVTQFSPSTLDAEGVPVYRAVQQEGEFIVTFPRAYHSGFNSGFNCAEAVNLATLDWLPYGQNAIELYSQETRKTSLSHDKLLLGAGYEAFNFLCEITPLMKESTMYLRWKRFCEKNGELTKAIDEARLRLEEGRIEALGNGFSLLEMDKEFDLDCEKECVFCLSDLHLTASGCTNCSIGEYTCTKHANDLCSCEKSDRFILYRYTEDKLSSLARALEEGYESDDDITWTSKSIEESGPVIVEEEPGIRRDFDLNLEFQFDASSSERSQKKESSPVTVEEEPHRIRDFDLNLDLQLDDEELNAPSETSDDASMMNLAPSVKPINLGSLVIGDLWCNKHAIFPKGFKSRVKFYNVQDPMRTSYYMSEIEDAGSHGPLFRVTLEGSQEDTFCNLSAQKCWEMVLRRVNKERTERSSQGQNVQTLENIDGLLMFGFRSKFVIQATEALDPNHRLEEYWNHKNEKDSLETNEGAMADAMASIEGRPFEFDLNRT